MVTLLYYLKVLCVLVFCVAIGYVLLQISKHNEFENYVKKNIFNETVHVTKSFENKINYLFLISFISISIGVVIEIVAGLIS